MEVLENGSHIKDSENKTTGGGGNYSCRMSRDISTIGSSSARGETNVQLLLACKAQLSSEVVRLKTESLCLQKERDATRARMKELDQMLVKLTDRTRELENRLHVSEDENKRLRGRVLNLSNASALQKLSVSLDKFHSYPWSGNNRTNNPPGSPTGFPSSSVEVKKCPPQQQEDWKDVSQRLLEQMRLEMRELQQMGSSNFSEEESCSDSAVEIARKSTTTDSCLGDEDDVVEESLSSLQSEMESLKLSLLKQHRTLKSLMKDVMQGNVYLPAGDASNSESKAFKTFESNADKSAKAKSFTSQLSRHSDDSFRAFFTKQLEDSQNIDKMTKTMQLFLNCNAPELSSRTSTKTACSKATKSVADKKASDKKPAEEERVCPICQESFDESIPQKEFEQHVLEHLEVESASLLDQYVVL